MRLAGNRQIENREAVCVVLRVTCRQGTPDAHQRALAGHRISTDALCRVQKPIYHHRSGYARDISPSRFLKDRAGLAVAATFAAATAASAATAVTAACAAARAVPDTSIAAAAPAKAWGATHSVNVNTSRRWQISDTSLGFAGRQERPYACIKSNTAVTAIVAHVNSLGQ